MSIALGVSVRLPIIARRRQPHDSVTGCRERAANDLLEAATMDSANGRSRLEHSAATWSQRADLLEQRKIRLQARISAGGRY